MATKPLFVQAKKSFLKSPITNADTSLVLSKLVDIYGNALAMASFGAIAYLTVSPGGDDEEIISFTGVTQNSDGTATLTGLVRGLKAISPYSTGGTAYSHSAGAIVVASDNPQIYQAIVAYIDAISIAGAANASSILQGLVQIASAAQITAGTATGSTGAPIAMTPDQLVLSIYGTRLPSQPQKDALGGTAKTPSTSNYFPTLQDLDTFTGETDQTQSTSNGTVTVGEANATTKHSLIAQKVVLGTNVQRMKGVRLWKIADTGSFAGTVKVALQADSAGSPSGADLASFTISNAAWLKLTGAAEFEIAFSTEASGLTPGGTYHIVVSCSTNDTANHPNFGINTAGGYASGVLKYNNSTDGWVVITTSILYFKTTHGVIGRYLKSDSTEGLVPVEVRPSSIIAINSTNSGALTGDTTEHVVYSKQFAGGFFSANAGAKIRASLSLTGSGAGPYSSVIKLKYNGSVVLTVNTPSLSASNSPSSVNLLLEALFLNNNSVSSQITWAYLFAAVTGVQGTSTANSLVGVADAGGPSTAAVDLSQPGLFEITVTNTNTGSSLTWTSAILEKIAA